VDVIVIAIREKSNTYTHTYEDTQRKNTTTPKSTVGNNQRKGGRGRKEKRTEKREGREGFRGRERESDKVVKDVEKFNLKMRIEKL
jgi:hypothetical protein